MIELYLRNGLEYFPSRFLYDSRIIYVEGSIMAEVMVTSVGATEGKRYMISDAAKLIEVETHVLRYWEEELDIHIPRNEMGHRYYTDYYIQAFRKIKELKEQGFLLKAIKIALPEIMDGSNRSSLSVLPEGSEIRPNTYKENKVEQFQMILGNVVTEALRANNDIISGQISKNTSEMVIKEMDYLMRLKEEREEERFKKFDELIRGMQKSNKENAIKHNDKKKRFFGK